ncbi:MAG TPA: GNAT family N-acetyltransferase [Baekduia sp.]|uniref:GNAT family N-acetyltransferase n=1 Tax=Baekduia sp. TaxID=2600305 RepID=UPI002D765A61|nr:GNAT family N-acetyltransferase [Baekduia sp.]HET6506411.1 GNAT family N-acetyltransferase [Baekduia sp.]
MPPAVRLVPFSAAHLEAFAPMTADPDVLRYTRFPDPPEPDFPRVWLARYDAGRADGTKEAFAILDGVGDDGELLGVALAVDVDRATGEAELGCLVAPGARGRGVATAAVRQLTAWALEQGLARLVLMIAADNTGSRTVAERCGYALERVEEDAELRPGRRGTLTLYVFSSESNGAPQDSRSSGGGTL